MKKQIFFPYNTNLDSFIKPKNNINKPKSKMTTSPIPSGVDKRRFKKSINIVKQESNSNKLFYNLSLNKTNINNTSISKEKNKDENYNDLLKQNDVTTLKKNIQIIKIEIEMVNKMIKDNYKNIELLMENLNDLNIEKNNQQKIFENNLSKKESLEEICNTIINNIKNNNLTNINDDYYIEITLDDIKNNNKNIFINRVFKVFNFINNLNDSNYLNYIGIIIEEAYSNLYSHLNNNNNYDINSLINQFFHEISSKIYTQIICKTSEKAIYLLLQFLLKINITSENIHEVINFLEHEYKDKSKDINQKITDIEIKINCLQTQKDELIALKKDINEKINIFSKKKTPFCEKTIYQKRLNRKDLLLNNISSTIHFSTECINKSNSNSIEKKKINTCSNNNTFNNNNNNVEDLKQRKILYRNMMKFFNKNNKTCETSTYHSNRISIGKINLLGKSGNCSNEKNDKNIQKINYININKNYKKIEWTQKKDSLNKIQPNGINNDIRERNFFYLNIKELSNYNNLTENIINNNKIKVNKNNYRYGKDNDNGKTTNIKEKEKKTKTERVKNPKNKTLNINSNDNYLVNDCLKPIYKNEKYKLAKIFSVYDMKPEKKTMSINKDKNFLCKYLSKNNNKDTNKGEQILSKKSKNLIYRMKNKNKTLNEEIINNKKSKNIYNTFDKTDIKINNKINKKKTIKYNIEESFCYYKLLENDSKLFNPLNNDLNLNKLGYNEGFISIDSITKSIKIASKKLNFTVNYENNINNKSENNSTKNKSNIINIQLKDITKIYLNNIMKNIIIIHNVFLKYNFNNKMGNVNGISSKKFSNINKLLNIREIMNIKDMEQSEKIKAGLCNFFSFILEFNNKDKIECIMINFFQFNEWLYYLEDVVKNNFRMKKDIPNGNGSCSQNDNNIFKLKPSYQKLESKQYNKLFKSVGNKK